MNPDLIYLFVGEIAIILFLYKFIFRQMIVNHWEEKIAEDNWLVINLEPVIDEIEDRFHEKLELFQQTFFGSVGQMVKKGKDLDPMNNIRKAAKDNDWTSMLVEYAANKAGVGGLLGGLKANSGQVEPQKKIQNNQIVTKPKKLLNK
jgi:hypothetical protein